MSFRFARPLASLALVGALVATTVGHAFADPRDFTFINGATDGSVVARLFVSTTDTTDWEEDTLGKDVLNPGEQWTLTFGKYDAGKCLYDIKIVTAVGAETYAYKVDLCSASTVTYHSP